MKLRPTEERVVIKRDEDITSDILVLPSTVEKASLTGKVIEAGPDCISVKTGDRVLFARWSGFELPFRRGSIYFENILMNEKDIIAIIEED